MSKDLVVFFLFFFSTRKLIGARYYDEPGSSNAGASGTPRDKNGHGTHVASTAAGIPVKGASYYGLAEGTAKGGSPGSRIAMYRVCTLDGCQGSAILKGFDDAIADGVDVLSLSLGATAGMEQEFSVDPIAIGAFHAVEKGIIVVCSGGNEGPNSRTAVNIAPWILTVAATTIDRDFESDVVLGGNKVIKVIDSFILNIYTNINKLNFDANKFRVNHLNMFCNSFRFIARCIEPMPCLLSSTPSYFYMIYSFKSPLF